MASDAAGSAADAAEVALLSSIQQRVFTAWPVRIASEPSKGRFMIARESIPAGRVLFQARAYCKGVHESFKKRVCDTCLAYNEAGRYEISCSGCHSAFFCSTRCRDRAMGLDFGAASAAGSQASAGASTVAAPATAASSSDPLPASELHTLDCALLKKLSSCKLDKARIGVVRMLLRAHRKAQCEQREEAQNQTSSSAATAEPQPAAAATGPVDGLTSALSKAQLDDRGDLLFTESLPAPLTPTHHDLDNLVGHALPIPAAGTPASAHQLDLLELRRYLTKLSSTREGADLDVDRLMQLMAKVEANAFGLYAPRGGRKTQQAMVDGATSDAITVEASSADPAAESGMSVPSAAAVSDSSAAPPASSSSSPPKYIGVLLYPLASFFNHSCSPNVRAVQHGLTLTLCAAREVAQGEELCIEYVDTVRPVGPRRAELKDLYCFDCSCERCRQELDEEAARAKSNGAGAGKGKGDAAARQPHSASARERGGGGGGYRKAQPKRKLIVPKSMREAAAVEAAAAEATVAAAATAAAGPAAAPESVESLPSVVGSSNSS